MKKTLVIILVALTLSGCATTTISEIKTDPALKPAGQSLALDYLNAQKRGESVLTARSEFGDGIIDFLNLVEINDCSVWMRFLPYYSFQQEPTVVCRVKAGNKMGGITWGNFGISFSYSPQLRSQGDKYLGLRIKRVFDLDE